MKITKKISVAGQFAKLGVDFDEGDVLTILNSGDITTGQFGEQHTFKIKTKKGDRNMSFNQTSLNYLIDAFGEDTETWINKEIKVWVVDMNVQGKMRAVAFLTDPTWKKVRVNGELRFIPTVEKTPESGIIETDEEETDIPF